MPKTLYGTRKDKAENLLRLVIKGPDFTFDTFGHDQIRLTREERVLIQKSFESAYRNWSWSWIVPLVEKLLAKDLKS